MDLWNNFTSLIMSAQVANDPSGIVDVGRVHFRGVEWIFKQVDVKAVEAATLVLSTDPGFMMNVGAAHCIWEAGGPDFQQQVTTLRSHNRDTFIVPTDQNPLLKVDKVMLFPVRRRVFNSIRPLYRSILTNVRENCQGSVAMPIIGAGRMGMRLSTVVEGFVEAICTFDTFRQVTSFIILDRRADSLKLLFDRLRLAVAANSSLIQGMAPSLFVVDTRIGGSSNSGGITNTPGRSIINLPTPPRATAPSASSSGLYANFYKIVKDNEVASDTLCAICLSSPAELDSQSDAPVKLNRCNHFFHRKCIDECFAHKKQCPLCMKWYTMSCGTMPAGSKMRVKRVPGTVPGHPRASGFFKITYTIPSGIQGPEHPRPGKPYSGATRSAYLPNDVEGQELLTLLRKAFDYRHTFTIGDSHTTSAKNVVVWAIHHKTATSGGPANYGYPDPHYYDRLRDELENLGLDEDHSSDDDEGEDENEHEDDDNEEDEDEEEEEEDDFGILY